MLLKTREGTGDELVDSTVQFLLKERTVPDSLQNHEEVKHLFEVFKQKSKQIFVIRFTILSTNYFKKSNLQKEL